ncbi:thiolase family protein [Nocardioides sp. R-C-SC26]|uniref:thiolase family protein n=1 Tax=Nocardioides sp. R-C-SC26 TaxID=2870414 RepID=UPI001E3CAFAD|nr:thiolase family protein [Nocardioides sp. R-C-SC26]
MRRQDVHISGVGMTRFAKQPERSVEELGTEAVLAALDDAGMSVADAQSEIDAVYVGSGYGGPLVGQRMLRRLGLTTRPVTNVENACSSSSSALNLAVRDIASGQRRTVLAVGVDSLSRLGSGTLPLAEDDSEVRRGMTMPAVYAMRAERFLHERGATVEDLARVVVKSRAHAAAHPLAHFQQETTLEAVLESRPIATPLTLMMCSPRSDGGSAAVITAEARPGSVRVLASEIASGRLLSANRDMTRSELSQRIATQAYEVAGVKPSEIDVAEVHDAFAIAELMYYESLGWCEPGEASSMLAAGETTFGGSVVVNAGGGLISRGHPVGATGLGQVAELVWQLRGSGPGRTVEGAELALAHCTGGGIGGLDHGACSVTILAAT